ncbi:hypothetical protein LCGC14_2564080 [marine sediment metagenome]|uniref:Uncharacterized protein n=1 Tax=marine sediment metagenome TaxID=412755 RepID=A0A0F9DC23_9ZZZZ
MSVEAQVLAAVSDFEAAGKKQRSQGLVRPDDVREAARKTAAELIRQHPPLGHSPGLAGLERMFALAA